MNYYILESDGDSGIEFFGGSYSSEELCKEAIKKANRQSRFIIVQQLYVLKTTPKEIEFTKVDF